MEEHALRLLAGERAQADRPCWSWNRAIDRTVRLAAAELMLARCRHALLDRQRRHAGLSPRHRRNECGGFLAERWPECLEIVVPQLHGRSLRKSVRRQ